VVDDDPTFQRYAQRVVTASGHLCTLAASADEARRALAQTRFDLLITDIQLTDGNGLELLRFVSDECGFLPVIVVTGFPTVSTAVDALRLNAMDYLVKPAADLDECVSRVLRRVEQRRAELEMSDIQYGWSQTLRDLADQLERDLRSLTGQPPTTGWIPAARPPDARSNQLWEELSPREADVARLLLDGFGPPQISEALHISVSTVRNHLQSAFRKTGARTQVELIAKLTRT